MEFHTQPWSCSCQSKHLDDKGELPVRNKHPHLHQVEHFQCHAWRYRLLAFLFHNRVAIVIQSRTFHCNFIVAKRYGIKHFAFASQHCFLSSKVFVKIALLYSLYACVIKLRQDSVISTRLLPIGRLRASQHLLASISKMRSLCVSGLFWILSRYRLQFRCYKSCHWEAEQ